MYIYSYIYIYSFIYIYTHTYIQIYIYTCIHTYTAVSTARTLSPWLMSLPTPPPNTTSPRGPLDGPSGIWGGTLAASSVSSNSSHGCHPSSASSPTPPVEATVAVPSLNPRAMARGLQSGAMQTSWSILLRSTEDGMRPVGAAQGREAAAGSAYLVVARAVVHGSREPMRVHMCVWVAHIRSIRRLWIQVCESPMCTCLSTCVDMYMHTHYTHIHTHTHTQTRHTHTHKLSFSLSLSISLSHTHTRSIYTCVYIYYTHYIVTTSRDVRYIWR